MPKENTDGYLGVLIDRNYMRWYCNYLNIIKMSSIRDFVPLAKLG